MTPLQKVIFIVGAAAAISLGSTVIVLILDRMFPNQAIVTIIGPLLCAGAALVFSKWYYGRL